MTTQTHAAAGLLPGAGALPLHRPANAEMTERRQLHERFASRLVVKPGLTRKTVSYQGSKDLPGFRWFKYKEGFSRGLVSQLIEDVQPSSVLDPFAGIGTTPLVAAGRGLRATGIEIMPVGVLAGNAIAQAANGFDRSAFEVAAKSLLERVKSSKEPAPEHRFRHVRITEAAFPKQTESELAKAKEFIAAVDEPGVAALLNVACMSILESVSFTRKDGQYLRWDYRSGRSLRARIHKGPILDLKDALAYRLAEIQEDVEPLKADYGRGEPYLITGSSLSLLRMLGDAAFDAVITSPPYANRYDYTRTYALELAWLGYSQDEFKTLRQQMLSATVENKSKITWLQQMYKGSPLINSAFEMYQGQGAIHEVLGALQANKSELSNPHVIRLIQGYFLEMAVIIAEMGRVVRPGGTVFMVNDNVQYHGEEVPVDLILSDFAEQSGFRCEQVSVLPRGKGNSSQQMGRFGRREIRKCIYRWVRTNE